MKFGVEVFWRKILSTTAAPAEDPTALNTFEPLLGPNPIRPNPSGFDSPGVTWTAKLRLKTVQRVGWDNDLLKA